MLRVVPHAATTDTSTAAHGYTKPSLFRLAVTVFVKWLVLVGPAAYLQKALIELFGDNASLVTATTFASRSLLSLIMSPLLGARSDAYGRKPFLVLRAIGSAAFLVPVSLPEDFWGRIPLAVFFYSLSGLAGNAFGMDFAYCADVARLNGWHLNETVTSLLAMGMCPAFLVGAPLCTAVAENFGEMVLWRMLLFVSLLNIIFVAFCVPETIVPDQTQLVASRNPLVYFRLLLGQRTPQKVALRCACASIFLLYIGKMGVITMGTLFTQLVFNWTAAHATWLSACWGVSQFGATQILGISGSTFAGRERFVAGLGILSGFIGMVLLTTTPLPWLFFPAYAFTAIAIVTYTSLCSYAAPCVPASRVGELQALLATTTDLGEITGPLVLGVMLYYGLATWPRLPFFAAACFTFLSALMLSRLPSTIPDEAEQPG